MMQVLVTGGAGFIGSHTVALLLANGCKVVVLDNLVSGKTSRLDLTHPNLTFVEGDVLNYPLLLNTLQHCQAVLHLAALPSVPASIADPIHSLQVNTQGFLQVLQAIREVKKPIRLVYASSAAVYGAAEKLPCCDETELTLDVLSPYALEKANNERYARLFAQLFGVQSLGLRYFNVYGPGQDPASPYSGVIARFLEHFQRNAAITVLGDGEQSRDFIYVGDVARANLLALQSDYCGVLNIATGVPKTLLDLIHCFAAITRQQADIHFAAARPGDIRKSYGAVTKAEKYLNFHYTTELMEGLRKF